MVSDRCPLESLTTDELYQKLIYILNTLIISYNTKMIIAIFKKLAENHLVQLENDGHVIGSGIFNVRDSIMEIQSLQIANDHRNVGLGTKLISEIIGYAQKNGVKRIELVLHPEDPNRYTDVERFYKKNGFLVEGNCVRKELK